MGTGAPWTVIGIVFWQPQLLAPRDRPSPAARFLEMRLALVAMVLTLLRRPQPWCFQRYGREARCYGRRRAAGWDSALPTWQPDRSAGFWCCIPGRRSCARYG